MTDCIFQNGCNKSSHPPCSSCNGILTFLSLRLEVCLPSSWTWVGLWLQQKWHWLSRLGHRQWYSFCLGLLGGFPGGSAGKESTCNARDLGLIPGLGRSPREGDSCLENSIPVFLPGEFHGLWTTALGTQLPCCEEAQATQSSHSQPDEVPANSHHQLPDRWVRSFQMIPALRFWATPSDTMWSSDKLPQLTPAHWQTCEQNRWLL